MAQERWGWLAILILSQQCSRCLCKWLYSFRFGCCLLHPNLVQSFHHPGIWTVPIQYRWPVSNTHKWNAAHGWLSCSHTGEWFDCEVQNNRRVIQVVNLSFSTSSRRQSRVEIAICDICRRTDSVKLMKDKIAPWDAKLHLWAFIYPINVCLTFQRPFLYNSSTLITILHDSLIKRPAGKCLGKIGIKLAHLLELQNLHQMMASNIYLLIGHTDSWKLDTLDAVYTYIIHLLMSSQLFRIIFIVLHHCFLNLEIWHTSAYGTKSRSIAYWADRILAQH